VYIGRNFSCGRSHWAASEDAAYVLTASQRVEVGLVIPLNRNFWGRLAGSDSAVYRLPFESTARLWTPSKSPGRRFLERLAPDDHHVRVAVIGHVDELLVLVRGQGDA
jgi:hypothetical protein